MWPRAVRSPGTKWLQEGCSWRLGIPAPQPLHGHQPLLSEVLPQRDQVAHLLEVAPLHGAVLHLPKVHVAKVVRRLPLEEVVSQAAPILPAPCPTPASQTACSAEAAPPTDPTRLWGGGLRPRCPGLRKWASPLQGAPPQAQWGVARGQELLMASAGLCTPSHTLLHAWCTGRVPGTLGSLQVSWPTPQRLELASASPAMRGPGACKGPPHQPVPGLGVEARAGWRGGPCSPAVSRGLPCHSTHCLWAGGSSALHTDGFGS